MLRMSTIQKGVRFVCVIRFAVKLKCCTIRMELYDSQCGTSGSYGIRFALKYAWFAVYDSYVQVRFVLGSRIRISSGGSANLDILEPFLGVSRLLIGAQISRLLPCEEAPNYGRLTLFLSR